MNDNQNTRTHDPRLHKRRTSRFLGGLVAAVTGFALLTVPAAPGAHSDAAQADAAQATAPSGQVMPVGDLPGWHQVFADDFTTDVPLGSFPAAVSSNWTAYPSPWKDTSGQGTYSPGTVVSVGGGLLNSNIHTANGVAMVSAISPKLAAPMLYGRFAVRYRFDSLPGYKMAWLLWPDSDNSTANGEVDFPEMNLDATSVWAFDHHINNTGPDDKSWNNAPLTPGGWHTAVIEWSPNLVVFNLDGSEIGRDSVRVTNTAMHWVLQTETDLDLTSPPPANVNGNVQIDWAAVWAYNAATADTTAPTVSMTAPAGGASLSNTTTLSATAADNKAVVGVQFQMDGVAIGAEVLKAPFMTPWNTGLTTSGTHTLTAVARDNAGNQTTSAPVTVTVSNAADVTAPTVVTTPAVNGTIFPIAAGLTATFSETVTGVDTSSFSLKNATTGAAIPAEVKYRLTANASLATLKSATDLTPDTNYTIIFTNAIKDNAGNPMAPTSINFVTGPAPTATPSSPASGATGVSRTANITATASEDLARVYPSTFTLKSSTGAAVVGVPSFDTATNVASFNPDATLDPNTQYTASMNGVKDLAGNPLAPLSWSFTTGTAPLTLAMSAPAAGTTVSGTTAMTATAAANQGIVGVQFQLDGVAFGPEATTAPYSTAWNTTLTAAGTHTITAVARDNAGNTTTATAVSVTVNNVADTIAPTTLSLVPKSNGTVFPVTAGLSVALSEAVTGVDTTSFTLVNTTTGAPVPATVGYVVGSNKWTATLIPKAALANETRYTATVTSAIKDNAGNPLTALTWSFATGPNPTARVSSPASGATNVGLNNNITATSNVAITRVGNSTFSLTASNGTVVSAVVTYNTSTNVATLDPRAALSPNTTYTAALTSGIQDLAGNGLVPLTWSFTTGP